jgi:hypothetical protein
MPSKKKVAPKKPSSIELKGAIPTLKLSLPLDEKKIAEIQRCIAKGTLAITVSRVDLVGGRLGDPYKYD